MSDLFTIDCHACGAKNTIDTETMRRVETPEFSDEDIDRAIRSIVGPFSPRFWGDPVEHLGTPEPAGDSDWPEPAA